MRRPSAAKPPTAYWHTHTNKPASAHRRNRPKTEVVVDLRPANPGKYSSISPFQSGKKEPLAVGAAIFRPSKGALI
jgi:hypothetical protein